MPKPPTDTLPAGRDWNEVRLQQIGNLLERVADKASVSDNLKAELRRDAAFLRDFIPTVVRKRDAEIERLKAALKAVEANHG